MRYLEVCSVGRGVFVVSEVIAHTTASRSSLNGVLIVICDLFAVPDFVFHRSCMVGYSRYSVLIV